MFVFMFISMFMSCARYPRGRQVINGLTETDARLLYICDKTIFFVGTAANGTPMPLYSSGSFTAGKIDPFNAKAHKILLRIFF